ncbi:hypothetical protein GUITHDRAFT_162446 [Guillardia theta CCMP2712]|uniref:BZIP domain-containing protein n=1 Tax=Guillardia theta (strain CCMP2712) TaxID=905079 RepID=L1JIG3_GUITC|nr:hypothetical protein GUITHDRAFT_162446 [Guillardia theta CCMP2712]EKX48298.1 hypothetical protein GUITHDRAFT_162446 [Guillardia theta CCMP2712]|eukprot:XP_005835278.1 hypothetical protein GUITHDRAFT_162446 [Guillardia theta CCMP2712]
MAVTRRNENKIKTEPADTAGATKASSAVKVKDEIANDFDTDLVKVCGTEDCDSPIFSTCGSPDDIDESAGSELGDYELSYLHSLYHGDLPDTILPDAVAPPSLGSTSCLTGLPCAKNGGLMNAVSTFGEAESFGYGGRGLVQPDTPPRGGHDSWDSDSSPRCLSPCVPSGPVPKSSLSKASNNNRKRKAGVAESAPSKCARAASVDISEDGNISDAESASNRGTYDGLEIRPEDDPLGLFKKDPATLTPEEQRILKKQRRLLKNRESAQLSRHRKKMHLHSLEKQVDQLKKEKAALASRVQELVDENDRLRKQILLAL